MAQTPANIVADYLRQVTSDAPSDAEILQRFATSNDGDAFALILRRYGTMVLGVCRRGAGEWAEDAFQATFLALARAPGRVTESLPGWLHRVATRMAQRCARRRSRPLPAEPAAGTDLLAKVEWGELRAALDAELAALPSRWRTPLVLCYLDGLTRDEAAGRLNLSLRTVHRRLDEGRRRLRDRLTRRGLAPVLLGASVLSADGLRAAVPDELMHQTFDFATGVRRVSPAVEGLIASSVGHRGLLMKVVLAVAALAGGFAAATAGRRPVATTDPPRPQTEQPARAEAKLASGKWALYEWRAPMSSHHLLAVTVDHKDGKPAAVAAEGEDFNWKASDLTVSDRHVRVKLTRDGSHHYHFDGLIDPADPTRVLGSLKMDVTPGADRAVLELVRPGAKAPARPQLPADYRRWIELEQERFNAEIAAERAVKEKAQDVEAVRTAAAAAKKKYDAEVPALFRKLVVEQAGNAVGLDVLNMMMLQLNTLKPAAADVEKWITAVRPFVAAHGPQFEATTIGQFGAYRLIRHPEYVDLARKLAAEADEIGARAELAPYYGKVIADWDEERAAWAAHPNPPAADAVWTINVSGRVTDAKGAPVEGAEVTVNNVSSMAKVLWNDGSNTVKTGADGRYRIALKCQGPYRMRITKMWAYKPGLVRAYDTNDHKLLPGQSATVDFVLKPGEPFGGTLKVRSHEFDSGPAFQHMLEVKGDGVWELVMVRNGDKFSLVLPPGKYTVELHRGHNNLTWAGLKTGKTDHTFEERPVAFTPETAGAGFDQMWKTMDRNYSYFSLKPEIDWAKLRDEYRPKAVAAKSADELAAVLQEMLGKLRDGHVWIVKPNGQQLPTFRTTWAYNGNRRVILDQLTETTECGQFAVVGKTKPDGFGYFLMTRQSAATPELLKKAIAAIEKLADTPGFIIDLRTANGGNEQFAQEIARLFCEKRGVYAKSKYRNGPGHDEFDQGQSRELPAAKSGKPYLKPVVCLLGPGCVSSGEGFAKMMAALPHVTTVGLPTRGSSGNPGVVEVGDTGLKVYYSRWVDMLPDGTPIEGKGVPVKVKVEAAPEEYKSADPTLAKSLEILRKK